MIFINSNNPILIKGYLLHLDINLTIKHVVNYNTLLRNIFKLLEENPELIKIVLTTTLLRNKIFFRINFIPML
jgi:hypothetical protein